MLFQEIDDEPDSREIVPEAESASRTFSAKVTGPCPPGVYPGMFGRMLIPLDDEDVIAAAETLKRDVIPVTYWLVYANKPGHGLRRRHAQASPLCGMLKRDSSVRRVSLEHVLPRGHCLCSESNMVALPRLVPSRGSATMPPGAERNCLNKNDTSAIIEPFRSRCGAG